MNIFEKPKPIKIAPVATQSPLVKNVYIQGDLSWYNKGTIALQKKKYEKALGYFKKETDVFKELYLNMGNAYRGAGNLERAYDCYVKANDPKLLDLEGFGDEFASALGNLGLLSYMNGNDADAGWFCNRALMVDPLHMMTIWNFSLVLLREYCSGGALHKDAWKMHEYRFRAVKAIDVLPWWDGVSVVNGPILVLNEQGMGDKIMYGRYLKLLEKYCTSVVVQCAPEMDWFFSDYKTVRSTEGYTLGIPFGVLPKYFGIVSDQWLKPRMIPTRITGGKLLNVYVEWEGSASHINNENRSCYAGYFSKLAKKFPDVAFYNARPEAKVPNGVRILKSSGWGMTAAMVNSMDLVISVDTSIVHLAGSMGIETWMMQPLMDTDFRWGNPATKKLTGMDVESNIWYDSVTVIENKGWDSMFAELEKRLLVKCSERFKLQMLGGYTVEEFVEKASNVH